MKPTTKKILKWLYIAVTIGVILFICLFDPNIRNIWAVLGTLSRTWVLAAVGSMLVFWLSEAILLNNAMAFMHKRQSFWRSLKTSLIGQYYSALTPFSMGGQPVQVVYMKKDGIPVGTSTSILVLKFLLWQAAVFVLATCALLLNQYEQITSSGALLAFVIIGMTTHVGAVVAAWMALLKPQWISKVSHATVRLLARMRLLKNEDRHHEGVDALIGDFRGAMDMARKYSLKIVVLLLLSAVQAVAYMGVTYFLYRAFGFDESSFMQVVLLQGLVYVSVSFVPLPGAAGASEGGFYLAFSSFFGGATSIAMLIWRVFTYYSHIIIGALIVLYDSLRVKKKPPQ